MTSYNVADNLAKELATNTELAKLIADAYQGRSLKVFLGSLGTRDFEHEGIDIFPCAIVTVDSASGGRGKDSAFTIQVIISTTLPAIDVSKPISTEVNNLFTIPGNGKLTSVVAKITELLDSGIKVGANYEGYSVEYDLDSQVPVQFAVINLDFSQIFSY